jgi:benzil reductase ((S)-benzoin forming)
VDDVRLAIMTGGSRGLGAAMCEEYLKRGWTVLEFSRSAPHQFSVRVDLSDPSAISEVFTGTLRALAVEKWDEVVAISNAAILGPVGPVENARPDDIAAHLDTNVVSAILFARAFVATFQDLDCTKTFVNISSGAAAKGYAGWSLYCASKAAMENFVRSVALEQSARRHPINAISVNPGVMDTDMQAAVRASRIEDFPSLDRFLGLHRDGLLNTPAEVAVRIADVVSSRPEPGSVCAVSQ